MPKNGRNIIVIGASMGGLEVLDEIVGRLQPDLPASLFVVQHIGAENTGDALVHRLNRHKKFRCKLASDNETFKPGTLYIAPSDNHLLLKKLKVLVTKGARENRYRPAIDPLFRSAAVSHGPRVIGVLLTGMLDDGTAGLMAIQKCGGVTVVQDPKDAAYPDMPENALNNMRVDHCIRAAEMASLFEQLTHEKSGKHMPVPKDVQTEAEIAERVLSDVNQANGLGQQAPYNCPNCGGVLWEMDNPDILRFRCHTGHSFTAAALVASQTEKIEETLWVSLRMFEERKNLLNNMSGKEKHAALKKSYAQRAKETQIHIERIRAMLVAPAVE